MLKLKLFIILNQQAIMTRGILFSTVLVNKVCTTYSNL